MDEYKKYLADRLLSEEQPVTYRLLSRALGVHVNTAKEMLYDYLVYQNAQKPDSIHATYLVYGIKREQKTQEDGDVEMSSSMPEHDSISEEVPATTLALVREENLKDVLAAYQEVQSVHVYSLAPHPQRDLSLLSDVTKSLSEYRLKEPDQGKYGTISNPHVRRRDRQARPKAAAPAPSKSAKPKASSIKPEPSATQPKPAPGPAKVKQESSVAPSSEESTPSSSSAKPAPSTKKGGPGGIMSSFAKAAQRPPKPKPEPKKEDTAMALSDDGEADDDDIVPAKKVEKEETDTGRKSRKEREEELRRMMEEDDDEEEQEEEEEEENPADAEMDEAPEPEPEPQPQAKEDKEPSEVVSSTGDGRRRGKRRVMKKKRILDDQGYMVTIQEPGWESFSEDEAPPAKKPAPAGTPQSSGAKPKKAAGKGAQGNIMSFFSKK